MIYHEGDETPELLEMPDEEEKATEDNPNRNPDGSFAPKGTGDQTGGGSKDAINQPKKDLDDTKDTKDTKDTDDTKDTEKPVHWNKHVYTVQPESQEAFDNYVKEQREKTTPTKEEVAKNKAVEKSVIDSINAYIKKQPYGDKVRYVETQGSFAKGTDLAGSSDLDIFVAFDKSLSLEEIKKYSIDLGENVLKPMSDEGSYKLMTGAEAKKYGESNVNGVEVQILSISDVTLEDIQNGDMVSAQDRSPHHTKYMKNALQGKEQEARVLKRFMKDAQVYDASQKSQGFSGFSTEVLIDNLDSFESVLEYYANFEMGSTLGEYTGTDKTPIRIGDPIDPSRNLGSAFSQQEGTDIVSPNKKLARLVKTAQAMLEKGEMPKITTEKLPSISLEFNVDNDWGDPNKIAGQLNKAAKKLWKKLEKEGFTVKAPKDKVTEQWSQEIPRINVSHDAETGKATIDFGFDNFDRQAEIELPFDPTKIPEDRRQAGIDNYLLEHKDDEIVKNEDGTVVLFLPVSNTKSIVAFPVSASWLTLILGIS
jgi:tRNA CCA-adding enzyme